MNKNISKAKIEYIKRPNPKDVSKILEGMKPALIVLADS